ncbi:hypothetical protein H072_7107 [Dactylellina haptotyla CBS 200.50]|uniref:ZZ-type domain-containing protein n=1 Tax=Dactylellina haptotyla (strain CBS 200.50) TaxID=1284197 RepID=S8A7V4_DACHA|nr:hypothetical protein H072_7107 [Dactylellina haptotyla CBS 200.50]
MQAPEFNRQDALGLRLVRTPPSEIGYTCDIIILHGLNGGPAKSFRHPEGGNIWFADFLPVDIVDVDSWTNARIWTYGYEADKAFGAANSSALDFARSLLYQVDRIREGNEKFKIIWVCHSLGGIVAKTALVEAQIIPQYQPILTQTAGVIFLGTPHTGSAVMTVADIGAKIAGVMLPDTIVSKNRKLINCVRKDSGRLFETAGRFANICGDMKIFNMYEAPSVTGSRTVERDSAVMNLGKIETQFMLDGTNHRTMCIYKDRMDQNYLSVLDAIKKLTRSTSTLYEPLDLPAAPATRAQSNSYFNPSASTTSFGGLNGFGSSYASDNRSQASYNSTSTYSNASQTSTAPTSNYSSPQPPPPRPPAKEPVAAQWPHYFNQDQDRRYPPSTIYGDQGQQPNSQNSRPDNYAPPSYSATARDMNYSSAASVFSATSSSSLYDSPSAPAYRTPSGSTSQTPNTQISPSTNFSPYRPSGSTPTSPEPNRSIRTPVQEIRSAPSAPSPSKPTEPEPKPTLPPPESPHWICDGCKNPIYPFESRIHCLDCPDYDLCGPCHAKGTATKGHKGYHKEEFIIKARQITQEQSELVIPSEVHPEVTPGRLFRNWTIQDERRVHHLSCNDDHARYLISSLEPGNYRVSFHLDLFLIKEFTEEHIKQLGKEPLGKLRIAVGYIKNKKSFFKEKFPEDKNLISRIFEFGWYDDFNVNPQSGTIAVDLKCILSIEGNEDRDDVGILFQWSEFRKFQSSDKALISFALISARFEDLMEFDPDFGGAIDKAKPVDRYTHPPSQEAARAPVQTPAQAPAQAQTQASSAESGISALSLDDIFQAIMEVAQEERDRQEREAFQQAIAEELARRRRAQAEAQEREAAAQLMANYMVATQATVEFALLNEYLKHLTGG